MVFSVFPTNDETSASLNIAPSWRFSAGVLAAACAATRPMTSSLVWMYWTSSSSSAAASLAKALAKDLSSTAGLDKDVIMQRPHMAWRTTEEFNITSSSPTVGAGVSTAASKAFSLGLMAEASAVSVHTWRPLVSVLLVFCR